MDLTVSMVPQLSLTIEARRGTRPNAVHSQILLSTVDTGCWLGLITFLVVMVHEIFKARSHTL
jgi:hypothetical protein